MPENPSWPECGHEASIFLAGPSPRGEQDLNWRPDALAELEALEYNGFVYIPLPTDGDWSNVNYEAQVFWELSYLEKADCIAFWMPRHIIDLPGFTSNVEFGMFLNSGKIVLGYPEGANKMKYLDVVARHNGVPVVHTLAETMKLAMKMAARPHTVWPG